MAEEPESTSATNKSLLDKITEKLHDHNSSSSSFFATSEEKHPFTPSSAPENVKPFFCSFFLAQLFLFVLLHFGFCEQIQCGNVVVITQYTIVSTPHCFPALSLLFYAYFVLDYLHVLLYSSISFHTNLYLWCKIYYQGV